MTDGLNVMVNVNEYLKTRLAQTFQAGILLLQMDKPKPAVVVLDVRMPMAGTSRVKTHQTTIFGPEQGIVTIQSEHTILNIGGPMFRRQTSDEVAQEVVNVAKLGIAQISKKVPPGQGRPVTTIINGRCDTVFLRNGVTMIPTTVRDMVTGVTEEKVIDLNAAIVQGDYQVLGNAISHVTSELQQRGKSMNLLNPRYWKIKSIMR